MSTDTHASSMGCIHSPSYVCSCSLHPRPKHYIYNVLLHLRSFACITLVDAMVCCHLHQQLFDAAALLHQLFDAAALLHQHLHFLGELVYLSLHLLNGGLHGEMGGGGGSG